MERLLKWFTIPDEATPARLVWFTDAFREVVFEGTDKMLMLYLEYCANLGIQAKRAYLETFLRTEGKRNIKSHNIRVESIAPLDYSEPGSLEEAYQVIAAATLVRYDQCLEADLADKEFKVDMLAFMKEQQANELQKVFAETYPKFTMGENLEDISTEVQARLSHITEMYSEDNLEDLDFMTGKVSSKKDAKENSFLFKTALPCVDKDMGGMYSKHLWTFTGPTGGGKTRLALIHFAYQAAVYYKLDVLVDELELSEAEVENILIAHHIVHLYKGKVKIPDSVVNHQQADDIQMRYWESARMDLFESGKYGKFHIRAKDLEVETMYKKRLQFFKLHRNCRLWIIDYIGRIESNPIEKFAKQLLDHEIINKSLKLAKRIAQKADIGVLAINQFTKEGNEANNNGKPIIAGMVEGGKKVQYHADYDLVMTMTPEQELAHIRMLSTTKARSATGFRNVEFDADCSVSIFRQRKQAVA